MFSTILFYLFLLSFGIQLVYYLFSFSRLTFYKKPKNLTAEGVSQPPVSVIVCAHNEEQNLKFLIDAISKQDYPNVEIIIIDDRSTDDTSFLLKELRNENPNIKVITVENVPLGFNSKKYGLTLGIKSAKSDVLIFTDADCYPVTNQWVKEMVRNFHDQKKIVLGYSQYNKQPGFLNTFIRFETLYTGILYISSALAGRPYMGVGRNIAHRRSFFLENKGFKNHLKVTGGDDDLYVNENGRRKNTVVAVGNDAIVLSIPKTTWQAYFLQKRRHLSVGKYYRFTDKLLLNILSVSQLIYWITFFALLITWTEPYIVISGFILRTIAICYIFHNSSRKLGDKFETWKVPVFDLLFVFYYFITGYSAFFSKDIKWK